MVKSVNIPSNSPPWNTVYDVADASIPHTWLLTGGLMVQLHAMLGGLQVRPTTDVDLLVDLMSDKQSVSSIRSVLSMHGFSVQKGTLTGYTTRMVAADGRQTDILVADHLPRFLSKFAVLEGSPILAMPGGAQARERSMNVMITDGRRHVTISVPDLLGALVLKSAAFEADRSGFGDRHLYDAATLASLIENPDTEVMRLHSRTDRKRLKLLHDVLLERSPYWDNLDDSHKQSGLDAIEILASW